MFINLKRSFIFFVLTVASASSVQAAPETVLANICAIVESDDEGQLRKKLKTMQKDYNMRLPDYYEGITCGGLTLIRYAIKNEAVNAGGQLIKKMSKKALRGPMSDGSTELAWAEANGFGGSAVTAALKDRIN